MQLWVLHDCVSWPLPAQGAPLYCAAGFVHDLVRSCVPPLHVTVQLPQDNQLDQSPSTIYHKGQYINWCNIPGFTLKNKLGKNDSWSI